MQEKTELRKYAKAIRKGLDIKQISHLICNKIRALEEFKNAQNVMIYYPLKDEIDLLELLDEDKNFFLPRMRGLNLNVCPYKKGDKLEVKHFCVKEPKTNPVAPKLIDLMIVPALMIDSKNYRLGYGKGFYDRLITKTNAKTLVGLPKELYIENLPIEPHDKAVDIVITV